MDFLVLELYYQRATKVNSISLADVRLFKVRHIHLYFSINCTRKTQWGLSAKSRDTDNEIHSLEGKSMIYIQICWFMEWGAVPIPLCPFSAFSPLPVTEPQGYSFSGWVYHHICSMSDLHWVTFTHI